MADRAAYNRRRSLRSLLLAVITLVLIWGFRSGRLNVDHVKAAVLEQVAKVAPNASSTYRYLGNYRASTEQWQDAVAAYSELASLKPKSVEAYIGLSECYRSLKRYDDATKILRTLIQMHPNYAFGYVSLGYNLSDLGQYQQAIEAYQKALELEPDMSGLYLRLGRLYAKIEQDKKAIANLKRAIDLDDKSANARYELAKVWLREDNTARAMEQYQALLPLNENLAQEILAAISRRHPATDGNNVNEPNDHAAVPEPPQPAPVSDSNKTAPRPTVSAPPLQVESPAQPTAPVTSAHPSDTLTHQVVPHPDRPSTEEHTTASLDQSPPDLTVTQEMQRFIED